MTRSDTRKKLRNMKLLSKYKKQKQKNQKTKKPKNKKTKKQKNQKTKKQKNQKTKKQKKININFFYLW